MTEAGSDGMFDLYIEKNRRVGIIPTQVPSHVKEDQKVVALTYMWV